MQTPLRFLSRQDVRQALPMAQAIEVMRESFTLLYQQQAKLPPRMEMSLEDANADILLMPVYAADYQQAGLKVANVFRDNPAKKLPLIQGLMLLIDTQTGQPCAMMDSAYLTALRTAAGSALATDLLAHPEAKTLALFGTGATAITHLEALCSVRNIEKVYVYGRSLEKATYFAQTQAAKCTSSLIPTSDQTLLSSADIICTTTSATMPLFEAKFVMEGTHIVAIGSYKPQVREIPGELVAKSKIVVDDKAACLKEAGDILIPLQEGVITMTDIVGELGEVLVNSLAIRKDRKDITFYKSVGVGIQDLTAAHYILKKAEELNLGILLNL